MWRELCRGSLIDVCCRPIGSPRPLTRSTVLCKELSSGLGRTAAVCDSRLRGYLLSRPSSKLPVTRRVEAGFVGGPGCGWFWLKRATRSLNDDLSPFAPRITVGLEAALFRVGPDADRKLGRSKERDAAVVACGEVSPGWAILLGLL